MQDYQQRVTVATADGIELELELAGLGSRFIAGSVDLVIKAVIVGLAGLGLSQLGDVGVILVIPLTLAVYFGYDVLFEMLAAGRTPGKRWSSLRVLRLDGRPVDLASSAVRNVLRLVDGLLLAYLPGMISITLTPRQQRLGDLAAGTIVVRERRESTDVPSVQYGSDTDDSPTRLDATGVTEQDLGAVRSFLERRSTLAPDVRARLAERLAVGIADRVGGDTLGLTPEQFLERVARARARGGGR